MNIIDALLHWSFLTVSVLIYFIGEGIKGIFYTSEQWKNPTGWRKWFKKTMWIHPILTGALIGFFASLGPDSFADKQHDRIAYFALAGALSMLMHQVLKTVLDGGLLIEIIKKKFNVTTSARTTQKSTEEEP